MIEIDAATNRGIDEIRELREAARYRPARDRYKIWILDEAHQITDAAFNALLKTLEEPPSHVIFMMATTQPEDIPQTIRSRCQHFSFHAVSFDDIVGQLRDIASQEGIAADDNALAMLAEAGDGSMRDALSIMDQAIASCGDTPERRRGARAGRHRRFRHPRRRDGRRRAQLQRRRAAHHRSPAGRGPERRSTSPARWCASCAMRWSPKSPAAILPCCRFPPTNARASHALPSASAKKTSRASCRSCCAPTPILATSRSSAFISNWAC